MPVETIDTRPYRYPGTKFFEANQQEIFFGREQETRELTELVKAYDVFLIFADSGIGKTSLLNAGLIPELAKENMVAIKFRFPQSEKPPLETVFEQLQPFYGGDKTALTKRTAKLWPFFKACMFGDKVPVMVFDQFEEFFNHPKPDREQCINELADLVNAYLPDYIRAEMREIFREKDPSPVELKYYTPPRLKLLFLIRSDKLKLMDDLSLKIPLILRNRYHLKPLSVKQAEQAILLPALLPKSDFASPPFNFQEEAVKDICNYLKNEEGEVEGFQLQILCQEFEKRIISRFENNEKVLLITRDELGGEAGLDNITKHYYTNQLLSIQDVNMRQKAVELIEDKLIVKDRRTSLPEDVLNEQGYSPDLLDELLKARLIRSYFDRNKRHFEISHDRLLPSILKLKNQRKEEEFRINQQKELERFKQEQEEKNRVLEKKREEERKNLELKILKAKLKNARRLRIYISLLILLLAALALVFFRDKRTYVASQVPLVKFFINDQNIHEADSVLNAVFEGRRYYRFFNSNALDTLLSLKVSLDSMSVLMKHYYENFHSGDSLASAVEPSFVDSLLYKLPNQPAVGANILQALNDSTLLKAKALYQAASETGFTPLRDQVNANDIINNRLSGIDESIATSFGQCLKASRLFIHKGNRAMAREAYDKAARLYVADSIMLMVSVAEAVQDFKDLKAQLK